jgi:lipopolysaccharide export system permease protein
MWSMHQTLSRYLARTYGLNLLGMSAILLGIVLLFDTVELLRRAGKHGDVPLGTVLEMGLLKLPEMSAILMPFSVLFSALFTFWQLGRRQELVILRAAGVSVWQFLAPFLLVSATVGVLMVGLVNPLGSVFYSYFNTLEKKYLDRESATIAVFDEGLWLKQDTKDGYAILHSGDIEVPSWTLREVMVLFFNEREEFSGRIDAVSAALKPGNWLLQNVVETKQGENPKREKTFLLPTTLTTNQIEDSFSSPQTMGFWSLPSFIGTLESTGFDSTKLRIHFQSLLSQPLLYAAMVFLAACVALRPQRQGGTFLFIAGGVLIGFLMFFMSNFLLAMGGSHQIPVFLAAWSPALISSLTGIAVLLTLEDG